MEDIVKDVVNIGLGAAERVKTLVNGDTSALQFNIDELKSEGAANESETATKVRGQVDDALNRIEELRGKVDTIVAEGQQKLSETLSNLNLPAVNVDDIKANFESYAAQMQDRLNEVFEKIKPVLESLNVEELRGKVDDLVASIRGGQGGGSATPGA